jgi:hypothetical protein
MSPELTASDTFRLERLRLQRFRSFFPEPLISCFLHLQQNNTLAIHCAEPWMVDQLLTDMSELRWYAWMIVGAKRLSIYFAQEEVYKVSTRYPSRRLHRLYGLPMKQQPI